MLLIFCLGVNQVNTNQVVKHLDNCDGCGVVVDITELEQMSADINYCASCAYEFAAKQDNLTGGEHE